MTDEHRSVYSRLFSGGYCGEDDSPRYFMALANAEDGSLLDIGSGKGFVVRKFLEQYPDARVVTMDYDKYHDIDCEFQSIDLDDSNQLDKIRENSSHQITCLDVLEHLEPDVIDDVVRAIAESCDVAMISVAHHADSSGQNILHKIVKPREWWEELFGRYFEIIGSDMIANGLATYFHMRSKVGRDDS